MSENRLIKFTEDDAARIKTALTDQGFPSPSNVTCSENVLRYLPGCDARDAMLGTSVLEKAGLNVAYDGNPNTTECGIDYDTDPPSVAIMVIDPLFKPSE